MVAKQYGSADQYEKKLEKVMERFGVGQKDFNYNFDRHGCWIEFRYRGQLYRFDHSVEKAKAKGVNLRYGSDAFAQLVLALEDLARLSERGIYDLQTWVAGMLFLPPPVLLPDCFKELGFKALPADAAEINDRYRSLAKTAHRDGGGSDEAFLKLQRATEDAKKYLEGTSE